MDRRRGYWRGEEIGAGLNIGPVQFAQLCTTAHPFLRAAGILYYYPFPSSRGATILWGRLVTCGRLGVPFGPGLLASLTCASIVCGLSLCGAGWQPAADC